MGVRTEQSAQTPLAPTSNVTSWSLFATPTDEKNVRIYDGINQNSIKKETWYCIYFNKAPFMTSDSLSKS